MSLPTFTPDQMAHEESIRAAQAALLAAASRRDKQIYWQAMVAGINARDPALTDALERDRLKRAGL